MRIATAEPDSWLARNGFVSLVLMTVDCPVFRRGHRIRPTDPLVREWLEAEMPGDYNNTAATTDYPQCRGEFAFGFRSEADAQRFIDRWSGVTYEDMEAARRAAKEKGGLAAP